MSSETPYGGNRQDQLVNDLVARGSTLLAQGRVNEAVSEFEVAYRLVPALAAKDYARGLLAQGSAQEEIGDREAALKTYQLAHDVAPDPGLQTEIANIIRDLRERDTIVIEPTEGQSWRNRGIAAAAIVVVVLLVGGFFVARTTGLFGGDATPTPKTLSAVGSPTAKATKVPSGPTATAKAMATAAAKGRGYARDAQDAGAPVFGPKDVQIQPEQDGVPEPPLLPEFTNNRLTDFRADARFINPDDAQGDPWDYGFVFRWQSQESHYQIFVTKDARWELRLGTKDNSKKIQSGKLEGFNTAAGGGNDLRLIAVGKKGYFYVNGTFVAELDLTALSDAGLLSPATEMLDTDEAVSGPTGVTGFTVWVVKP